MNTVRVKKDLLRTALKGNRATHVKDFEITWEAFRKMAVKNFEARLAGAKKAKRGDPIELWVDLTVPANHVDDYDQALAMLDWEVGDEVELQQHEFSQLVQDNWGWKGGFAQAATFYTASASPSKKAIR